MDFGQSWWKTIELHQRFIFISHEKLRAWQLARAVLISLFSRAALVLYSKWVSFNDKPAQERGIMGKLTYSRFLL